MPNYDLIFKKAKENKPEGFLAVVVGVRGSAKSGCAGTFPKSNKVLLAHYTKENHAILSAQAVAKKMHGTDENIIPYLVDTDDAGNMIYDPDRVFANTIDIFSDVNTAKHFDVVYLDGLSALDPYIHSMKDVMAASKYDISKTVLQKCGILLNAVKEFIRKNGKTVVMTCATESYENDQGVTTEQPKLRGSGSASAILGECPNILNVQMVTTVSEDGKQSRSPYFIFGTNVTKTSQKITGIDKDDKGATRISSVAITTNFFPRLARLTLDQTPNTIEASFEKVLALQDQITKKV
jgi:hypothetical protein